MRYKVFELRSEVRNSSLTASNACSLWFWRDAPKHPVADVCPLCASKITITKLSPILLNHLSTFAHKTISESLVHYEHPDRLLKPLYPHPKPKPRSETKELIDIDVIEVASVMANNKAPKIQETRMNPKAMNFVLLLIVYRERFESAWMVRWSFLWAALVRD